MADESSAPDQPPGPTPAPARGLARRARSLSGLTLLSRVFGVAREQVFARLFGAGLHADALVVAFRIPNLLRDLFAEGALSAALVPALSRARATRGEEDAAALARAVLSAVLWVVGAITVLGLLATPALVDLLAGGFAEGALGEMKRAETVRLTRILFPFLLLISVAAVLRGVLNVHRRFAAPALGPPLANLLAIVAGAALLITGSSTEAAATAWALALLAGGLAAILVQIPTLARIGVPLRPTLRIRHPELRRMLVQIATAAVGLAAVQVNIVIGTVLASRLDEGSVAALNYAFRLVHLPIGMVGVAIATVATVDLSARLAGGERESAARDLAGSLRLTTFLALPSAVGLWVLAEPIARLIYEYGAFTADDTALAASALRGYGIGLVFYAVTKVQVPASYALGAERLPLVGSVIGMGTYTAWALLTYRSLGVFGLAVGTSLAALVQAGVLMLGLHARLDTGGAVRRGLAASALLAVAMGLVCALVAPALEGIWGTEATLARLATVGVSVLAGVAVVLAGGRALGLAEATEVARALGLSRNR